MIIKTSELEGAALDWAVAVATNGKPVFFDAFGARMLGRLLSKAAKSGEVSPSTDWSQGGVLLDAHARHMEKYPLATNEPWVVWVRDDKAGECGDTLLIAAMRAIVAAELGDALDVPEELLP